MRCATCATEKSTKNHVAHVRAYMLRTTGSDRCIRKGCENPIECKSGYCKPHDQDWQHAEYARIGQLEPKAEPPARTCAKCDQPLAHPKSAYCKKHRKEYNNALRKRQQASK